MIVEKIKEKDQFLPKTFKYKNFIVNIKILGKPKEVKMHTIEIRHIYHSGFRIDYNDKVIFFDVYNHLDSLGDIENKEVYFFSTHSHSDHFNMGNLSVYGPKRKFQVSSRSEFI